MVQILRFLCQIIQWFLDNIWKTFLCQIFEVVIPPLIDIANAVLKAIQTFIQGIENFANAFGAKLYFSASIDGFIQKLDEVCKRPAAAARLFVQASVLTYIDLFCRQVKTLVQDGALGCNNDNDLQCSWNYTDETLADPQLPVATRCWAGFQPDAGDSQALSCSRADTCDTEDLSSRVLCDTCPVNPDTDEFLSFACSAATKKCTCGVQRFERTQCKAHSDCYSFMQGASCMMISSIFSTAFSTVPCSQCATQQVCVVTAQDQPGYCACPIQKNIEVESCSQEHIGREVTPMDSAGLCSIMISQPTIFSATTIQVSHSPYESDALARHCSV